MLKEINTRKVPRPVANYAQAIVAEPGYRTVYVAGVAGQRLDGVIPRDPKEQIYLAWENVLNTLSIEGMDHTNVVDVVVFLTDRSHVGLYRNLRDQFLKGHRAAATLAIVSGLGHPDMVVELKVTAVG